MPAKVQLKVEPRKLSGRKIKKLRAEGILPANIYGKDIKSLSVQVPFKEFSAAYTKVGETGILELLVGKETKSRPVLVHNLQVHPVSGEPLHADFRQVDLTKKVTVEIPVEITGEAPAIVKGGVLIQLINEIEVEALPTDLPDKFVVDVSRLEEIGQGISLKEIKIDPKVRLLAEKLDELVVKIEEPTKEEEKPVEVEPTEAEGEAEGEAKPEGEAEKEKEAEAKPGEAKPEEKKEEQSKTETPKVEKK